MIMITLSHNGWLVMAIGLILIPRSLGGSGNETKLSLHRCRLDCVDVCTMELPPNNSKSNAHDHYYVKLSKCYVHRNNKLFKHYCCKYNSSLAVST